MHAPSIHSIHASTTLLSSMPQHAAVHIAPTHRSLSLVVALATLQYRLMPPTEPTMPTCDVCGNSYDKSFTLTQGSRSGTFDSFECAIQAFAPRCAHCDCRIIGHGVEADAAMFCCAHCARHAGVQGIADRA